ncbi:MAG: hypothetical protein FWD53_01330 [Phycisphaerales bacterium]|nr:hypothetical protein [Phycisphaerales bacterium]
MTLRWPLRSFALTLLTLCLSSWAWSYFLSFYIGYVSSSLGRAYWITTYTGGVLLSADRVGLSELGWQFGYDRDARSWESAERFLGFAYQSWPSSIGAPWYVGIPFWFPSLLSAVLLWFIWRQTRPKTEGRGFPVEPTNPNQTI